MQVAEADPELFAQARAVLDANWTGHATRPSPRLYPHQWSWDSACIAIGYSSWDQARAETELRFEMKAGPTGSLFGSVTPTDIADELWSTSKIRVDRRKIGIDNVKRIGRYEVPIDLFQDVRVEVKLVVVPEGGELPSEVELEAMAAAERAEQEAAAPAAEEPAYEELLEEEPEEEPAAEAEPQAEAEAEPEWRADADAAALHRE